jgi:GNAT superfamily N-acetyltransferase
LGYGRLPASPARLEDWAIIDSLYVVEPERRLGLGRRLVAATRTCLVAQGATRFEISVMAVNETALAFWIRLGFRLFRVHLVGGRDASGAN